MTDGPPQPAITACVIARDEAANLAELLPLLRWADEVLVLIDDGSQDDSADVATLMADRVEVRPFQSFSTFRNLAIDLARGRWIFFVDADERVSAALANEIRAAITSANAHPEPVEGPDHSPSAHPEPVKGRTTERDEETTESSEPAAYWVARHNIVFGRLLRGGGWSPDNQLRLLRRGRCRYDESHLVHETVAVDGATGNLSQRLLHFNYATLEDFFRKQRRYTAMEAEALRSSGPPRRRSYLGAPLRAFVHRFFRLGGWVDGPVGLFLSLAMAYYAFERVRIARKRDERAALD